MLQIPEPVQLTLALSWEKCLLGHPIPSFWPIHVIFQANLWYSWYIHSKKVGKCQRMASSLPYVKVHQFAVSLVMVEQRLYL